MNPPALPDIERALDEVLSRPEFLANAESPLTRLLAGIIQELSRLFDFLGGDGLNLWACLLIFLVLGALILLIVRAVRGSRLTGRKRRALASGPGRTQTSEELLALADQLAAAGEPARALATLLAALLARLQVLGALRQEPGRTNRQYLADLRREARPEADLFEAFCRAFNFFRYGGLSVSAEDYGLWRRELDAVWRGSGMSAASQKLAI